MIEINSVFGTRNVYEGYATEAIRFTWSMNYVLRVLHSNSRSDCVCLVWETGQCVAGWGGQLIKGDNINPGQWCWKAYPPPRTPHIPVTRGQGRE